MNADTRIETDFEHPTLGVVAAPAGSPETPVLIFDTSDETVLALSVADARMLALYALEAAFLADGERGALLEDAVLGSHVREAVEDGGTPADGIGRFLASRVDIDAARGGEAS